MRIATWNVNSLGARLEKVWWWLDRAEPDVLLLQETKLFDDDAPHDAFRERGYELFHHGQGRWNGVAIASRAPLTEKVVNFGDSIHLAKEEGSDEGDDAPLAEARMISAKVNGVRVTSIYAPNGRAVNSPHFELKLQWFDRLHRWLGQYEPTEPMVLGGDFNVAPADEDVWDPRACHGGTHVSPKERASIAKLREWGFVDAYRMHHPEPNRYSWWDYRAGAFHKNLGMRIDHLYVTKPVSTRVVWSEIDREARKGKPTPSDHTAVIIDVDAAGKPMDAGWAGAEERIAARTKPKKK